MKENDMVECEEQQVEGTIAIEVVANALNFLRTLGVYHSDPPKKLLEHIFFLK